MKKKFSTADTIEIGFLTTIISILVFIYAVNVTIPLIHWSIDTIPYEYTGLIVKGFLVLFVVPISSLLIPCIIIIAMTGIVSKIKGDFFKFV